jgi:hypothetical protein
MITNITIPGFVPETRTSLRTILVTRYLMMITEAACSDGSGSDAFANIAAKQPTLTFMMLDNDM